MFQKVIFSHKNYTNCNLYKDTVSWTSISFISSWYSVIAVSKIEKQLGLQAGLQFFSFCKCLKVADLLSVSKRSFACLKRSGGYTCLTGTIANTILFMLYCELSVRMSKMANPDTVFQTHHRL